MARAPFQVLVLPYRRLPQFEVAVFRRADYDLWQFVCGGGEDEEQPVQAAQREVHEEANLPSDAPLLALDATTSVPACWFRAWASWPPDTLVIPEHAFAVDATDHTIEHGDEHLEFAWLSYTEAMDRLRFDSNKNALWELHERLFPRPHVKRPAYR